MLIIVTLICLATTTIAKNNLAPLYKYFKKEIDSDKIIVRINPATLEGLEILVSTSGEISLTPREFDSTIYEDLEFDEFQASSPLEFNLYLAEVTK